MFTLSSIIQDYQTIISISNIISEDDLASLFDGVEELFILHLEISERLKINEEIIDILNDKASQLSETYSDYYRKYREKVELFEKIVQNPKVDEFLKKRKDSAMAGLSLMDLLLTPLIHIRNYDSFFTVFGII